MTSACASQNMHTFCISACACLTRAHPCQARRLRALGGGARAVARRAIGGAGRRGCRSRGARRRQTAANQADRVRQAGFGRRHAAQPPFETELLRESAGKSQGLEGSQRVWRGFHAWRSFHARRTFHAASFEAELLRASAPESALTYALAHPTTVGYPTLTLTQTLTLP